VKENRALHAEELAALKQHNTTESGKNRQHQLMFCSWKNGMILQQRSSNNFNAQIAFMTFCILNDIEGFNFFYTVTQQYMFDYYCTVCFLLGNSLASESIQHSEHGKSLKSRLLLYCRTTVYIDNQIRRYTHSTYPYNVFHTIYIITDLKCHNPCSLCFW